jgi:CRISPR/Cas system CSM-associated protein Csm3 (group 7 of RAMP superfamily)
MKAKDLTHRYLAHFIVEADTPLAIGSGEKGFTVDRLITRDALGLPYIPGSSLAGVFRNELDPLDQIQWVKELFGFQEKRSDKGQGSRLIFSSGHLVGEDGYTVVEGLQTINLDTGYYSYFTRLPERDHVRMTHRGAADTAGHGKFDEELVHKGVRFAFRLELMGNEQDEDTWKHLLSIVHQPLFRMGAGTRKGFGKLKVINCETRIFDLKQQSDLLAYIDLNSSLNASRNGWKKESIEGTVAKDWAHYHLELTPQDFFLFAAGYGDEEVDNKPKTERYFTWDADKPELKERDHMLIPATSVKGALSHRVAWHYNRLVGNYINGNTETTSLPQVKVEAVMASLPLPFDIDTLNIPSDSLEWEQLEQQINTLDLNTLLEGSDIWKDYQEQLAHYQQNYEPNTLPVGEANDAVKAFFGFATDTKGKEHDGQRGQVVMEDIYLCPERVKEKIFSHVSIDRFTGGARDGMLFQQKVVSTTPLSIDIYVKAKTLENEKIKAAWEAALGDLCSGDLPLGGSTAKGHGIFQGKFQILNQPS